MRVHETADGQVTVRHQGTLLPSQPFVDKKPMVRQADLVANKRLDHILTLVQAQQRARDAARLVNPCPSRSAQRRASARPGRRPMPQ